MYLQILKLFFIITCAVASTTKKISYDEEKRLIISTSRGNYRGQGKIVRSDDTEIGDRLQRLSDLDAEELIDRLNFEESDHFLIFFLFGYSGLRPFLVFPNISSLYLLKESSTKGFSMKRILKNFRRFLFSTFAKVNTDCCAAYLKDRPASYKLLRKFEDFWYNRLERLAKRLLSNVEFERQSKLTKERISFLYEFLAFGAEFLLIRDYKRLGKDIEKWGIEDSPVFKNFIFLVVHLMGHLRDFDSCDFLSKFEWVASQDPVFIIYLFYFNEKFFPPEAIKFRSLNFLVEGNIEGMQSYMESTIVWENGILRLFGYHMLKHPNLRDINTLGKIILEKTERQKNLFKSK